MKVFTRSCKISVPYSKELASKFDQSMVWHVTAKLTSSAIKSHSSSVIMRVIHYRYLEEVTFENYFRWQKTDFEKEQLCCFSEQGFW